MVDLEERIEPASEAATLPDDKAANAAARFPPTTEVGSPGEGGMPLSGILMSGESGGGIYIVFLTSRRPRTVPCFRLGPAMEEVRRVFATFDKAA